MDSLNVDHVPPPEPEKFWRLQVGERVLLCGDPFVALTLLQVEPDRVWMAMTYNFYGGKQREVVDWLNLDKPCVAVRLESHGKISEPGITLTLRKVEHTRAAYLQVTANPRLRVVPR